MRNLSLPEQPKRTIHTPAIFDSPAEKPKTRANTGFQRSTGAFEAVHIRGLAAQSPTGSTAFPMESQQ